MVKIICCFLVVALLLPITGCKLKTQKVSTSPSSSRQSADKLSEQLQLLFPIQKVSVADDHLTSGLWVPKNQKFLCAKITLWLKLATQYKGEVPKSQGTASFNANIGPSALLINLPGKSTVTIRPASYTVYKNFAVQIKYVTNVLEFNNGDVDLYFKSPGLYDWLKKDQFRVESNRM